MAQIELSEDEVNEISAAASGHAAEREFASNGDSRAPVTKNQAPAKTKYHVKSQKNGKIVSTHNNAPDAVRARNKLGTYKTHSIIKEEFSLMEEIKNLINAIQTGKTLDIESSFNEVMSAKLVGAIDNRRAEIASSLFDEAVDEAVVPDKKETDQDKEDREMYLSRPSRKKTSVKESNEDLDEARGAQHHIAVTVTYPDHHIPAERKKKKVETFKMHHSNSVAKATSEATKHFTRMGYKVHKTEHVATQE